VIGDVIGGSSSWPPLLLLLELLYRFFVFLERSAVTHVYVLCLLQVLIALARVRLRHPLRLLNVGAALLLGRIALPLQGAQGVVFYFLV